MLPFQIKGVPSSFFNYSLQNWLAFTDFHAQVLSICKFNSRCSISLFSSWSDKAWTVFHLITSFVGCIEAPNLNLFQSNGNTQLITWPFFLLFSFSSSRVWDLEGNEKAHFVLRSPGMSVCWHPDEAFKVVLYSSSSLPPLK